MIRFTPYFKNEKDHRAYQELLVEQERLLAQVLKGEPAYADNLGWLDVEKWANKHQVADLENLASGIRQNADVFVLIGVGGSNNAARSVITALQTSGPEILYSGNSLSAYQLEQTMSQLEGRSVYVNCIAKNFETLEPGSSFRVFRQYLIKRYGKTEATRRIVVTGSKFSQLEALCQEQGYHFLEFPDDIGGRYTAMTSVGLLPMAVAGISIIDLVAGACDLANALALCSPETNPACQYASYRNVLYQAGYRVEMLASFEPQFATFHKWWLQLFGESEGKESKGLFPTVANYSEDLHAIGQFVQDGTPILCETFLSVREPSHHLMIEPDDLDDGFAYLDGMDFTQVNHIAFEATRKAHSKTLPTAVVEVEFLDAYNFGVLFYFFQIAAYLSCRLMGVNPFDQPGVETYKQLMFTALKGQKESD